MIAVVSPELADVCYLVPSVERRRGLVQRITQNTKIVLFLVLSVTVLIAWPEDASFFTGSVNITNSDPRHLRHTISSVSQLMSTAMSMHHPLGGIASRPDCARKVDICWAFNHEGSYDSSSLWNGISIR